MVKTWSGGREEWEKVEWGSCCSRSHRLGLGLGDHLSFISSTQWRSLSLCVSSLPSMYQFQNFPPYSCTMIYFSLTMSPSEMLFNWSILYVQKNAIIFANWTTLSSQHPAKETSFPMPQKPPHASYSHTTTPRATTLLISSSSFFFFLPHLKAWGILVLPREIKARLSAMEAWSPNHWTAREFPLLISNSIKISPLHLLFKIRLAFFKH